jgi:hypothetical protein
MAEKREPKAFSRLAEELVGDLRGVAFDEPARARKRPTLPLTELVEKILQENRIGREAPEHTLRDRWVEIVGPANASYSHPARIERNILTVLAAHAVVRNELFLHRAEIVARIQRLPGCENVRAINLRSG